ncbi:hypothetical protein ASE63_14440 [Bosea sp. Root381]|uniref:hypothetical protein n=1 Tax=Bosea sp. Root381 TaxID=1736524 RepID=UPI0006FB529F|nr:hypothetical protein [Bosea sp. Root381]KRE16907.1 hypothetical protein ASE63_14440 [Bosea sp. Root381]
MSRSLFIFLVHLGAAALAGAAVFGFLALSGATIPAWLLIGAVALLATGPVNSVATGAWQRWFG